MRWALMKENKIGGIPVVAPDQHLIGIRPNGDLRFQRDMNRKIDEVMTKEGAGDHHNPTCSVRLAPLLRNKIEKLPAVADFWKFDADGRQQNLTPMSFLSD